MKSLINFIGCVYIELCKFVSDGKVRRFVPFSYSIVCSKIAIPISLINFNIYSLLSLFHIVFDFVNQSQLTAPPQVLGVEIVALDIYSFIEHHTRVIKV